MKRPIVVAVTLAALAGSAMSCSSVTKNAAGGTCSLSTLAGQYGYEMHGLRPEEGKLVQYLEVGKESYDGKGKVTNSYTDTYDRKLIEITGTYTLDKNCQGIAHYSNNETFEMWVNPDGSHFSFLVADPVGLEPALSGSEDRLTADPAATCSTGSLKGTYRYTARGVRLVGEPYIEVGFETFDGAGKVATLYGNSDSSGTHHEAATYTVDKDCAAKIAYADGDSYTGFVSPDGSRFEWVQTGGGGVNDFFGGLDQRITTSTAQGLT